MLCVVSDGAGKPRPHDPVPLGPSPSSDSHTQEWGPCRPRPLTRLAFLSPDLVLCTFREWPAGGADMEEKSQGAQGRQAGEGVGLMTKGCERGTGLEEDHAWRGTGRGGGGRGAFEEDGGA